MKLLWFSDSKGFSGYPGAATYCALVAVARPDITYAYDTLPGRDTNSEAALLAKIAAVPNLTDVFIDLCVNDPLNGLGRSAAACVARLVNLANVASDQGLSPIIATPMHCLQNRGVTPVLDHEQFTEAVAEEIRAYGYPFIDVRAAISRADWPTYSTDLVHPDTVAGRQILANYIAPRL